MNEITGNAVVILLGGIIALIPIWKLIENHFDKQHAKELGSMEDRHKFEKEYLEAMKDMTVSMKELSKDITSLSSDFKELKEVQTDMFNDYLQLEDRVLSNEKDIENIKNTVFKKDYIWPLRRSFFIVLNYFDEKCWQGIFMVLICSHKADKPQEEI